MRGSIPISNIAEKTVLQAMLLKSKTNSGAASPKSSSPSMPMSAEGGAKPVSATTDEATARATEAAVAKAKEVICNGGTQADAAAAAREVARSVLKEMMQGSPTIAGEETSGGDSGANSESRGDDATSTASISLQLQSLVGTKIGARKSRSGGLPPLIPRNAGAGERVGLLSKFRKKMKSGKDKKMKSVIEEKSTQQVAYGNENGAVVNLAIEDSRDEVEVVPSTKNQDVANAEIVHSNGGDADERQDDIASNSSPAANAFTAAKEGEAPQLVTKYSSETTVTDSTYTSTYDDLDSYGSERVHHPRASYYIKDRREADDKDSVASEIDIFDALNMDSFLDALDDALFPVGTKNEGAKEEKKKTSKHSNQVDYEEDEIQFSCRHFFTGSGNCCAVDSDSSIGDSSMVAGGDSIQSDYVGRGYHSSTQKVNMVSKPVARASKHRVDTFDIVGRGYHSPTQKDDMISKTAAREFTPHVDTFDTVSKSASASLSQKEGDDIMKHSKSVSWADKNRAKSTSLAKQTVSGADRRSHVHKSGQKKTLSKLNNTSAAQHKEVVASVTEAEDNISINTKSVMSSNVSKVRSEEDGTVTDGSISSKMKNLFRNTMVNNPLWGVANAANQCHFPTGREDALNNPEITVVVNTEVDDLPTNWRDSVVDTVETTARPLTGSIDQLQIHNIQQQHAMHPPGQGNYQQQQQTVSPFQSSGGFHPLSPSSHSPQGVGFHTNHSPAPLSPQRYSTAKSPPQGNYYQTINGDGGQWAKQPEFPRYGVGGQPSISGGLPQINSNLSVVSADDKRDRYAGMEQQQEPDRYNQTMVTPCQYQVPVMGSPAVGGYGHTQHTGCQGMEARGRVDGSGGYNVVNDTTGYPNTNMAQHYNGVDGQNMLPQSMGLNSFGPNAYAYQQQQQHLEQQHNQPRLQFGMDNGQQYMQSPRMYE